jgi:hypothetical protein
MKKSFRFLTSRAALIGLLVLSGASYVGCASRTTHHETVQATPSGTTTTTTGGGTAAVTTTTPSSSTVVSEKTVVEHEEDANVLSRTVDIIGAIIALPFRLIAGLFDLIF